VPQDAKKLRPVTCQTQVQLAVGCHQTLDVERPVQHQQRLVTLFSVENGWLTFGLRGVYLYSSTSSMRGLLPI